MAFRTLPRNALPTPSSGWQRLHCRASLLQKWPLLSPDAGNVMPAACCTLSRWSALGCSLDLLVQSCVIVINGNNSNGKNNSKNNSKNNVRIIVTIAAITTVIVRMVHVPMVDSFRIGQSAQRSDRGPSMWPDPDLVSRWLHDMPQQGVEFGEAFFGYVR